MQPSEAWDHDSTRFLASNQGESSSLHGRYSSNSFHELEGQAAQNQERPINHHCYQNPTRHSSRTFKESQKAIGGSGKLSEGTLGDGQVIFPKARLLDRFDLCDEQTSCTRSSPDQSISKTLYSTILGSNSQKNMSDNELLTPLPVTLTVESPTASSVISCDANSNSPIGVDDALSPPKVENSESKGDEERPIAAQIDIESPLIGSNVTLIREFQESEDDLDEDKENGSPSDVEGSTTHKQDEGLPTCHTPHVKVKGENPKDDPLVAAAKISSKSLARVVTHPSLSRLKDFKLDNSLTLVLSQHCVNRVAFYGIIHDINKEATEMSKEDHSAYNVLQTQKLNDNVQITQRTLQSEAQASNPNAALVDEEEWLLSVIASRSDDEVAFTAADQAQSGIPASSYRVGGFDNFAYACGEKDAKEPPAPVSDDNSTVTGPTNEYGDNPNPVTTMNSSSRTQLWKPSRSWWEARSGKNPWIDAKNHIKRWRYLWPLIHYHKFLAKCIKKLKRNGFTDFLDPQAPTVIAFLRYEICAISNHLASCSRFSSDQWLHCLQYFEGWNDTSLEAQEVVREFVGRQKLRGFAEARDVQSSPLLRKVLDTVVANSYVDPEAELAAQAAAETKTSNKQGNKFKQGQMYAGHWHAPQGMGYGMPPYGMPQMSYGQPVYHGYGGHFPPHGIYPYSHLGPQGRMGWPRQPRRGNSQRAQASYGGGYASHYGMPFYQGSDSHGQTFQGPPPGFSGYPMHGTIAGQPAGWPGMPQVDETAPTVESEISLESSSSNLDVVSTTPAKTAPLPPGSPAHKTATPVPPTPPARVLPSPAHTVPASPYWSNFANQVVDYVCDSPFVPGGNTPGTPQHRMTPGHQLGDARRIFYGEQHHYHFGAAVAGGMVPPSPATQFVSTMSPHGSGQTTAFFAQMSMHRTIAHEPPMSPQAMIQPRNLALSEGDKENEKEV